jgi:chromatin remodeling complex protein RSC6
MSKVSSVSSKVAKPRVKKEKVVEQVPEEPTQDQVTQELPTEVLQVQEVLSFKQRFDILIKRNTDTINSLKADNQELRKLQREIDQSIKEASKKQKKKKLPRDFSKPIRQNGFAEPVIVSDELYSFLVKTKATMKDTTFKPKNQEEFDAWPRLLVKAGLPVARTDITSHVSKYIKEHELQNPDEKREIRPDPALKKIFSEPTEISKKDPTKKVHTYLKLQRYLNHHFPSRKNLEEAK